MERASCVTDKLTMSPDEHHHQCVAVHCHHCPAAAQSPQQLWWSLLAQVPVAHSQGSAAVMVTSHPKGFVLHCPERQAAAEGMQSCLPHHKGPQQLGKRRH